MKKYKVMDGKRVLFTDDVEMAKRFIEISESCLLFVYNEKRRLYQLKRSRFDD